MAQRREAEIERIKADTCCAKAFSCMGSGFSQAGRVEVFASGQLLECRDTDAATCGFSQAFGDGFYCKCPLRTHLARVLHM